MCTWLADERQLCRAGGGLPFPISPHGSTAVLGGQWRVPVGEVSQAGRVAFQWPRPGRHAGLIQSDPARFFGHVQVRQSRHIVGVLDGGQVGVTLSAVLLGIVPTLGCGYQVVFLVGVRAQGDTWEEIFQVLYSIWGLLFLTTFYFYCLHLYINICTFYSLHCKIHDGYFCV